MELYYILQRVSGDTHDYADTLRAVLGQSRVLDLDLILGVRHGVHLARALLEEELDVADHAARSFRLGTDSCHEALELHPCGVFIRAKRHLDGSYRGVLVSRDLYVAVIVVMMLVIMVVVAAAAVLAVIVVVLMVVVIVMMPTAALLAVLVVVLMVVMIAAALVFLVIVLLRSLSFLYKFVAHRYISPFSLALAIRALNTASSIG